MIVPVILAGGTGSRLWPLSRAQHPKQFHTLVSAEPLLIDTARRIPAAKRALPGETDRRSESICFKKKMPQSHLCTEALFPKQKTAPEFG